MNDEWSPPPGHPIDEQRARELVAGDYGDACRQLIMGCCRPFYWWSLDAPDRAIQSNGTVTLAVCPTGLLGITAAHVIRGCELSASEGRIRVQLGDAVIDDLRSRLIDVSEEHDLATFKLDEAVLARIGRAPAPISLWPPVPPAEGRGIMLGGFPGGERRTSAPLNVTFGLFTALGIAKTVSEDQITWIVDRDHVVESASVPSMPLNYELGGISGGPLITAIEKPVNFVTFRLGGIISEAHAGFEYVVAKRADLIHDDGTIARR